MNKTNRNTTATTGHAAEQPQWQSTDTTGHCDTPSIWYS